jgi:phosphoserine phosphatase
VAASPTHVATLISDAGRPSITPALLVEAARALGRAEQHVLAEGLAADLAFSGMPPGEGEAALRHLLSDSPVDIVVQPASGRRKRLFLADMDSTVIEQECIDELADLVGLKAEVAAITERAMRGEIAFEPALRERVALLKGLPVEVVDQLLGDRITLTPGGACSSRRCARTALIPVLSRAGSRSSPVRSGTGSGSTRIARTGF